MRIIHIAIDNRQKCTKRQEHCADVRPGSSRIYSCLLVSAEQVGSCIQMISC